MMVGGRVGEQLEWACRQDAFLSRKKETSWFCTHTGAHTQQRVQNADTHTRTHARTHTHSLTHHTNPIPIPSIPIHSPHTTPHTTTYTYIHTPPRTRLGTIKKRDKPGATCQGTYLLQLGYLQLGQYPVVHGQQQQLGTPPQVGMQGRLSYLGRPGKDLSKLSNEDKKIKYLVNNKKKEIGTNKRREKKRDSPELDASGSFSCHLSVIRWGGKRSAGSRGGTIGCSQNERGRKMF